MSSSNKDFIEETIKEKPVNKKKFAVRLLLAVIIAAAAACVAAFVFVSMVPVAEKLTGKDEVKNKISLTSEETEKADTPSVPSEAPGETEEPEAEEKDEDGASSKTGQKKDAPDPGAAEGSGAAEDGSQGQDADAPDEGKDADGAKEDAPEDSDPSDGEDPVTEIVREEIIYKELTVEDYISLYDKLSQTAEKAQRAVVSVTGITSMLDYFENTYENSRQLTGVIIADSEDELYILTGYSALENVERIQVAFDDGYISDAYFLRNDPDTGLAVIKVNAANLPEETRSAVQVASFSTLGNVEAGDRVMAIGTLLGHSHSMAFGTVISASGTFSASDCEYDTISTDIGAGGSTSGIILNLRGTVTGVIMPADKRGQDTSLTAFTTKGIAKLIETLSNNETRPSLGIHGMDVTDSIAERSGVAKGILITSIGNDSPAMLAGIMDHDVLVKIDGKPVMTMEEYGEALAQCTPGDTIQVVTMRVGNEGYTEMEFEVTVGEI